MGGHNTNLSNNSLVSHPKTQEKDKETVLLPGDVKPLLLHEDPWIRFSAAEYFGESFSGDKDIAKLILEAWKRYGTEKDLHGLFFLHRLPLDRLSFDLLLDLLCGEESKNAESHLNRAIARAPLSLLESEKFSNFKKLQEGTLEVIARRRMFSEWPPDRLWEELQRFSETANEVCYIDKVDLGYSNDLIESLARHENPRSSSLVRLLEKPEEDVNWLDVFLVQLAGERKVNEALPLLIDKLSTDDDITPGLARDAIVKIRDQGAVSLLRGQALSGSKYFRWNAAEAICRLRAEESEDALLALLASEEDLGVRTVLSGCLCDIFSDRGVDRVLEVIRDGYDGFMINLPEHLLPALDVLGREIPESNAWRKEREERETHRYDKARELAEYARQYDKLKDKGIDPFAPPKENHRNTYRELNEFVEPIVRTEKKIGRNAPCPCGSGRKHKKCCGRG